MKTRILDASAVLAWLWQEDGFDRVGRLLEAGDCLLSSVNLAEVITKVLDKGLPPEQLGILLTSLDLQLAAFDAADAMETAALRPATRHLGLSLGDRACLALARVKGGMAVTADRPWVQVGPALGIEIECIR